MERRLSLINMRMTEKMPATSHIVLFHLEQGSPSPTSITHPTASPTSEASHACRNSFEYTNYCTGICVRLRRRY
jgi:hypothetical protein